MLVLENSLRPAITINSAVNPSICNLMSKNPESRGVRTKPNLLSGQTLRIVASKSSFLNSPGEAIFRCKTSRGCVGHHDYPRLGTDAAGPNRQIGVDFGDGKHSLCTVTAEPYREITMHGQNQRWEQTPHLAAALAAAILAVVVLELLGFYARSLEYRSITALAADEAIIERDGQLAPVKNQGTALQQAAVDTGCLLPVYGSSELNLLQPYTRDFHPTILFQDRPTGFTIFPVGKAESTCLTILQKLAAVGPALKGRKVAISLSPCWFFARLTVRADAYAGNFSDLHSGELAFDTRLSLGLRQDAARRMLQFPLTLATSTAPSVRAGEPGQRLPLLPRLLSRGLTAGNHAQCDAPLPGSLERGVLSLAAPRKNLIPDFAAERSAAGLANAARAG